MKESKIPTAQPKLLDGQRRLLAQAYALILSWSIPDDNETADRGNFGEETQPAEGNASSDEEDAS